MENHRTTASSLKGLVNSGASIFKAPVPGPPRMGDSAALGWPLGLDIPKALQVTLQDPSNQHFSSLYSGSPSSSVTAVTCGQLPSQNRKSSRKKRRVGLKVRAALSSVMRSGARSPTPCCSGRESPLVWRTSDAHHLYLGPFSGHLCHPPSSLGLCHRADVIHFTPHTGRCHLPSSRGRTVQ